MKTSKYISRTLLHATAPLITPSVHGLKHFKLGKHQPHFASWLLTISLSLTAPFELFKRYIHAPYFSCWFAACENVGETCLQAIHSKQNNSGTFFCSFFLLNTLDLLFCGIFITKYNSHTYFVAVLPVNTTGTACLLVYNCWKRYSYLSFCGLAPKNVNETFLLASKRLNTLVGPYFMQLNL